MQNITRRDFINYAVLPGFKQRFHNLFATGFEYIAFFMALVYGAVRLLPEGHPYLNPANMGRYGVRHVIAEAANNIIISRNNIDQIILFICILFGVVLIAMQFGLLAMGLMFQPVMAAMPNNFAGFFLTQNEAQDIAHIMLDLVFGVPDLFNSCVQVGGCTNELGNNIQGSTGIVWPLENGPFPLHIHRGMHQLFQMYNIGLTVVAVFITIYFITTIILETAQSGTPFGKRFNRVWAPIRLVVAFGLLFPVGVGYNSAQYIVLYAAKFGSGFATNGWNIFNDTLGGAAQNLLADPDGTANSLIARPNIPEVGGLLQFLYVAKTCAAMESISRDVDIAPYLVKNPLAAPNNLQITAGTTYAAMMGFTAGEGHAIIRFGSRDNMDNANPDNWRGWLRENQLNLGFVSPTCGELSMKLADPRVPVGDQEPGSRIMQEYYLFVIQEVWFDALEGVAPVPAYFTAIDNYPENTVRKYSSWDQFPDDPNAVLPDADFRRDLQDFYSADVREAMSGVAGPSGSTGILGVVGAGANGAVGDMALSTRWATDANLEAKGWAGAAIWYNRIAEMNGNMTSSVLNIPLPTRYPEIMEFVYAKKRQQEKNVAFRERFKPQSTNEAFKLRAEDEKKATVLWNAFNYWQEGDGTVSTHTAPTGNGIIDIINALFGTEGLFALRRNTDIHPLAQLAGVGRSLVEGSIRNLTFAVVGGAGGALLGVIDEFSGASAAAFSEFLVTFAMIGLTAGFILFYVVPFLPFIYFFFAVGSWVKGIFEAMVGAPLWALAHIRIDGNGLSGQAAISGYFLIFEVFLRPILIVFGLLASISIFSALVSVLHQIFTLVTANMGGFDATAEITGVGVSAIAEMRTAIDEFFFTIIYTIIVYLIGMSSFKLVDLIPNNILRWMGQSVATFGDQSDDVGQGLTGTATIGAQQTLSSLGGGISKIAGLGKQ